MQPSAQDLDITVLNRQLQEANSTIALLEDRLATSQKIARMATDELVRIKSQVIVPAPSND